VLCNMEGLAGEVRDVVVDVARSAGVLTY
jgi:hypothetical protein